MAKKVGCACQAHKHKHSVGKIELRQPKGKEVSKLFAAAGGFTLSRVLRNKVMSNPKNSWIRQHGTLLWGGAMTWAGVMGFANLESDTGRYASVGFGIDGLDTIFGTIGKLKDNGIGSLVKRNIIAGLNNKKMQSLSEPSQRVRPSQRVGNANPYAAPEVRQDLEREQQEATLPYIVNWG